MRTKEMKILFYGPHEGHDHDLHDQAEAAYNDVCLRVKDDLKHGVKLKFVEMGKGNPCRPSDDVIACISYGDWVTKKIAANNADKFAGIPVFALTGTVSEDDANIFPLLPSPRTSGFLLARGIANIIKKRDLLQQKNKILFVCMKVAENVNDDDERTKSFERTIKAHCDCDCKCFLYDKDAKNLENEIRNVVDVVEKEAPNAVALFGYGDGFPELVSGISQCCPDTIILCDFNYSLKDNNDTNLQQSCLCLKSTISKDTLISGSEVFISLVVEVLNSINDGITEDGDMTKKRKRLLKWIPGIKYFRSSFGNFLFRGDNVLCYPIWQHTTNTDWIIDSDRDDDISSLAEIVSDKLNRAGRKVEEWKSGKIETVDGLFESLGEILPFNVRKFVFGCINPIPSQNKKTPYIYYSSTGVGENVEGRFDFLFKCWFSKLVMKPGQSEMDSLPIQVNLHGEDIVDNDTWRLYGVVNTEGNIEVLIPLWSVFNGINSVDSRKISAICVGVSDNRKVNEIRLTGKKPDVSIEEVNDAYRIFEGGVFGAGTNGVAYLFSYDGGSAIDFSARCIIWVDYKLKAYEIKILSNIMNMAFVAIADRRAQRKIIESSLKSAVGAIMSRNGSHNIGSHVLAALSHNVGTMPDDQVLYQYIQHRMDYIATATTERPSWCQSTMFVGEMVKRFLSQRHLLNFICKSEGLRGYEFQSDVAKAKVDGGRIRLHVRKVKVSIKEDKTVRGELIELDQVTKDFIKYSDWHGKGCDSDPIDLDGDVSLAIPGGIVGEHAFFTIIENIIRNAAKHDWSSPPPRTQKLKRRRDLNDKEISGDLDVFIDFHEKEECVDFFVWTNLSDVFAGYGDKFDNNLGSLSSDVVQSFLDSLQDVDMANQQRNLNDGVNGSQKMSRKKLPIKIPKKDADITLEPFSNEQQHGYRQSERISQGEKYSLIAMNDENRSSDAKSKSQPLGEEKRSRFDLLPLHQRQQVELEMGFIDTKGNLRRENWGLAEMKISAGYLMKAQLAEIGGLDKTEHDHDWKDMLIGPCCINDECWFKGVDGTRYGNLESLSNVWHLCYRFSVPKSKMILLLVNDLIEEQSEKEKWNSLNEQLSSLEVDVNCDIKTLLGRNGIFIRPLSEISARDELNYEYVLMDEFQEVKREWMLPFRVIAVKDRVECVRDKVPLFHLAGKDDEDNPEFESVIDYILKVIERCSNQLIKLPEIIKEDVCACWVRHLLRQRHLTKIGLDVLVEASTDGRGQSLITDEDVVEFAFNEGLLSALETYKRTAPELDREANNKFIEALISLRKCNQDGIEVNKLVFDRQFESDKSCDKIIKRQLRDWAKLFTGTYLDVASEQYLREESDAKKDLEERLNELESQLDDLDPESDEYREKDTECATIQDKLDKIGGDSTPPIAHLVDYLNSYCEQIKKLLSKYAEEIATLPEGFSKSSRKGGGKNLNWDMANVSEHAKRRLRYVRHGATPKSNDLYLEALSGTQSYLSTLERMQKTDYQLLTRLIENAMLRILVVDERTREFLEKHAGMEVDFARMNIFVADDKRVDEELAILGESGGKSSVVSDSVDSPGEGVLNEGLVTLKARTIFNARTEYNYDKSLDVKLATEFACKRYHDRYDIIIIHQGIIDKWLLSGTSHDKNMVRKFLDNLKKVFRYVVITTGRGTPANIPASGRVLPFSTIQTSLFRRYPEKMILTDAIMNILPIKAVKGEKNGR